MDLDPDPYWAKILGPDPNSMFLFITCGARLGGEDELAILDEDFDDDVCKLDVHDGGHRLLLGPQQGRPKAYTQVGHRHQVL